MRIAFVHSGFRRPLGGTELYTARLARSLSDRGHHVGVATGFVDRSILDELDGVETFLLPVRTIYAPNGRRRTLPARLAWHTLDVYNPSVLPWLRRTLRSFAPDVVHTHNVQGLSGAVFAGVRPYRHVHTAHDCTLIHPSTVLRTRNGELPDRTNLALRPRTKLLARLAPDTLVVFPNDRSLDLHRRSGWTPARGRTVVVPHGWALEWEPSHAAPASDTLRVMFLGRLHEDKGISTLLAAWGTGIEGAELSIAGDGPARPIVENAARGTATISYLGWVAAKEKVDLFANAHVVVFPSISTESFGLTCAEAILCGRPAIVSDIARPDFLRDGENGIVVSGGPAEWRAALVRLAEDRDTLSRLTKGAERTAAILDWERHVDRIEALYREVSAA
jgi:glycosyltransferase involved in cell wall biosynthesis